jgi:tetratricopeptide (TPR) repeat protein|tara:strand:+ start:323 stop:2653 length:2331 start_codon:yes stop_codon:yes gene_type:complete
MNNNLCKTSILNGGKVHPLIIPNNSVFNTNGTGLTNPSIIKIGDKFVVNIRHVQYALYHSEKNRKHQTPYGCLAYLNPEDDVTLTTVNYLAELDDKFQLQNINKVDTYKFDVKPKWEFIGLEDARLINWDDNLLLSGVRRDTTTNGKGRMEISAIENNKEISRNRIETPIDSYCEKNWMPILDMPNHYVKWCHPTEIVKVSKDRKSCKTVNLVEQSIKLPRDLRGGSQVIKYKDMWVALTHEVDLWYDEQGNKDAQYYHRFIVWNKNWEIVHTSDNFKFMDARIEFACGLHLEGDKFLITFGFQDSTAYLLTLPVSEFDKLVGIKSKIITKNTALPENTILNNYILSPENPQYNYNLGLKYFKDKQYASALSFFLRAAELEPHSNYKNDLTYESLIFVAKSLQSIGRRDVTELSLWNNVIRYNPTRPEGYLYLSQYYENKKEFSQSQSFAKIGLEFKNNTKPMSDELGYNHYYQLEFQVALCDWNLGQGDTAREKFRAIGLNKNYILDENYRNLVQINMTSLGCSSNPFLPYDKTMSENLRYQFNGFENINFNFSQTFQDMFVLSMLDGKTDGQYLEIGSADPYKGSNSALLEDLGWSGISLEILENEVENFRKVRKNQVVLCNALEYDYSKLDKVIDYLQLDCEPPETTYEIMTKLPFDKTDFKVITYEHDHYTDISQSFREKSRIFLKNQGYIMVVGDISPDENSPYEDWWVHPKYISDKIIKIMTDNSDEIKNAKTYMLSREFDKQITIHNESQVKNMHKGIDFSNAKFIKIP